MKRAITTLAATLLTIGGAAVYATPAAAAAPPTCNTSKSVPGYNGFRIWLPAYSVTGSTTCQLAQGNSGEGVRELQRALNRCFYEAYDRKESYWPLQVDGDFGPNTKKALTAAQDYKTDVAADIDGVYGPTTRGLLLWRSAEHSNCWFF